MYLNDLFENRIKNDPEIEYKEKSVKGVVDRVIAILTGNRSGSFTRLAQRYQRLDRLTKLMKIERDKLNAETKKRITALFDAEDEILTRVVETASLAATLSKVSEQNNEYFDIESYVEELEQLMPGLENQIAALRAKYTTIEKIEKSEALRVRVKDPEEIKAKKKLKTKESLEEATKEDLVARLQNWSKKVLTKINSWANDFDNKILSIRTRMLKDGLVG